jgi:hypothetical protein
MRVAFAGVHFDWGSGVMILSLMFHLLSIRVRTSAALAARDGFMVSGSGVWVEVTRVPVEIDTGFSKETFHFWVRRSWTVSRGFLVSTYSWGPTILAVGQSICGLKSLSQGYPKMIQSSPSLVT